MITNKEIEILQGLTKKKPIVVKMVGGTGLLHSRWFVLELPLSIFSKDLECWEDDPLEHATEWRTLLPKGESAYGQAMRFTNPKDNDQVVKLLADTGEALIHPSIYAVVMKHLEEPEFRVFPGEGSFVGIYSAGTLVGATAQVKF